MPTRANNKSRRASSAQNATTTAAVATIGWLFDPCIPTAAGRTRASCSCSSKVFDTQSSPTASAPLIVSARANAATPSSTAAAQTVSFPRARRLATAHVPAGLLQAPSKLAAHLPMPPARCALALMAACASLTPTRVVGTGGRHRFTPAADDGASRWREGGVEEVAMTITHRRDGEGRGRSHRGEQSHHAHHR